MGRTQTVGLRTITAPSVAILAAAGLGFLGTGCVSLAQHEELQTRFTNQESYVVRHREELGKAQHSRALVQLELTKRDRDIDLIEQRLKSTEDELSRRTREIDEAHRELEQFAQLGSDGMGSAGFGSQGETRAFVLSAAVLFPPGFAVLTSRGKAAIDKVTAQLMGPEHETFDIRVEGHTDALPIRKSGFKDNWELSAARARAVLVHMLKRGVDPRRMSFSGYGPHQPVDTGNSNEARARNRRVEIVLTPIPAPAQFESESAMAAPVEPWSEREAAGTVVSDAFSPR